MGETGAAPSGQVVRGRAPGPQGVGGTTPQPPPAKLQRLTVQGATQKNVDNSSTQPDAGNNWAAVRKGGKEYVIVEATTIPNTPDAWKQIKWSGDTGTAAPGKPNQRLIPRAESKKFHVKAELGGVSDYVNIWILGAKVEILIRGATPTNAAKFGGARDGSENLGAITYRGFFGEKPTGKIAAVATLSPKGVNAVITAGWALQRNVWSHDWSDGNKLKPGNNRGDRWNTNWVIDTSLPQNLKLTPDKDDKIYDIDAPDLSVGAYDAETYNNFQQWVEWNGEACSDPVGWYYQARWQNSAPPDETPVGKVTLNNLGLGNQPLPDKSFFHPKGPAPPPP